MNTTYPISFSHDEVWLFLENRDLRIEAYRLAVHQLTGKYIVCPAEDVITDSPMPIDRNTGITVSGCVWANTHDLTENPLYPAWLYHW